MTTSRSLSMRVLPTDPVELLSVAFDKLHDIAVEIDDVPETPDAEIALARWNTAFDETHRKLVLEPWVRKCNNLEWLLSVRDVANRELKATVASAQMFCETHAVEPIVERFESIASDAYELIDLLDESLSRVDKRTLAVDQHFRLAIAISSPDRAALTELKDRCIERGEQADFERYLEAANNNLRMIRLLLRIADPNSATTVALAESIDRLEVALLEAELLDS